MIRGLRLFSLLMFAIISSLVFMACSHKKDQVPEETKAVGEAQFIKGPNYYLKVVGYKDKIEIYPLGRLASGEKGGALSLSDIKIAAKYHFSERPEKPSRDMPTAKADKTIPLLPAKEFLIGPVKTTDMDEYHLDIDVKYKDQKARHKLAFKTN